MEDVWECVFCESTILRTARGEARTTNAIAIAINVIFFFMLFTSIKESLLAND
jgi:hypothetical protein